MQEIRRSNPYKKSRKTTVQLTSLLDLLFVMIFVSLIQQKNIPVKVKEKKKPRGKITKVKITPTPKAKPKVEKKKPTPAPLKTYTVNAIFFFYSNNANPNVPSGTYNMTGRFDEKTRKLDLVGLNWINRPKGYDMVPLSGQIEKTDSMFIGRIDAPGCKKFTLKRKQKVGNSPISGTWEGVYDCSQGATGLTLTIK